MRQMQQVLLTLLVVLMLSPALVANDKRDWANVEHLKPGTSVTVEYWNGSYLQGQIESADDSGLVLVGYLNPHPGLARTLRRDLIWKVRLLRKPPRIPDLGKCQVLGAIAGGVAGAIGAGASTKDGKGVAVVFGGGLGALGGYAGGAMACGVVMAAETPLLRVHRPKLIYQGARPVPLQP